MGVNVHAMMTASAIGVGCGTEVTSSLEALARVWLAVRWWGLLREDQLSERGQAEPVALRAVDDFDFARRAEQLVAVHDAWRRRLAARRRCWRRTRTQGHAATVDTRIVQRRGAWLAWVQWASKVSRAQSPQAPQLEATRNSSCNSSNEAQPCRAAWAMSRSETRWQTQTIMMLCTLMRTIRICKPGAALFSRPRRFSSATGVGTALHPAPRRAVSQLKPS